MPLRGVLLDPEGLMVMTTKVDQPSNVGEVGLIVLACPFHTSGTVEARHDYVLKVLDAIEFPWCLDLPLLLVGPGDKYVNTVINTATALVNVIVLNVIVIGCTVNLLTPTSARETSPSPDKLSRFLFITKMIYRLSFSSMSPLPHKTWIDTWD